MRRTSVSAFWDTSAVVPLIVKESTSQRLRQLRSRWGVGVLWWGTSVEGVSAICRAARNAGIEPARVQSAIRLLDAAIERAHVVEPTEAVRACARSLVERHGLVSADAFQLAAALDWCEYRARRARDVFVCLDERSGLREAAAAEGLAVAP